MATTIAPSLGSAPLYTQQGVGASPGYAAIDRRRASMIGLQEGVLGAQSFEVTQRASGGAAMFVDIAASTADALGSGIAAVVQGDSVTAQGLYPVPPHTALITEAITAAHASLPRVDMVVLEVLDNIHDSSGSNLARVRVVNGTATSGATLANRTGAAALPASCLLLADVLVAGGATSITNAAIRDRRKWARGVNATASLSGGVVAITSTTFVTISSQLLLRVECSGAPMCASLRSYLQYGGSGQISAQYQLLIDGAPLGAIGSNPHFRHDAQVADNNDYVNIACDFTPSAGSHTIEWQAKVSASDTLSFQDASAAYPATITVEEILRQNTKNNATTTG